jgi:hypothetical protein
MKMRRKQVIAPATPPPPAPPAPSAISTVSAMSWFTQATIILALISFVGYLFSLAYEINFCDYFSIPYYLISLSPTLVLYVTMGTLVGFSSLIIVISLAVFLTLLVKFAVKNRKHKFAALFISLIFLISGFLLNPEYRKQTSLTVLLIIGGILLVFYITLWVFLKFRKDELWWNESVSHSDNTEQTLLPRLYNPGISIVIAAILLFIVLGINGYSLLGKEVAKTQDKFPVFAPPPSLGLQSPEVAVIRMYGEYLYAVPFHRDTKQFENQLVIVKMSDIKTPLSFEKIGPLKPKE